jgi:ubiquinone/menaquinone biosynthesis C-methylase UbiE
VATIPERPATAGHVIHSPVRYDLLLWLRALGRERAFREDLLDLARLAGGESVLDIGCGTGNLALGAARRVGPAGEVHGVDPSPELIARARRKSARVRVGVAFENAPAEALPFPDAMFDVVLNTLVLHQIARDALGKCLLEIRRVLKPGGRLLAVDIDMGDPANPRWTPHGHGGGHVRDLRDIAPLLKHLGFTEVAAGAVAFRFVLLERMRYVLAEAPSPKGKLEPSASS